MTMRCSPVMLCRRCVGTFLAALMVMVPPLAACPYAIRDAGFIVRDPQPFRLVVVVAQDTPGRAELKDWVALAPARDLADSNVVAELLDLDLDPANPLAAEPAVRGLSAFPIALLVSPRGDVLELPGFGPEAGSAADLGALARQLVASPRHREIATEVLASWCTVLFVAGSDAITNKAALREISAASKTVAGTVTEMGQEVVEPRLIRLSPDRPGDRAVAWSLGLDGPGPRAAVVFGMARRLGPVLTAEEISRIYLENAFRLLGRNCTCTADPNSILGPAAPLRWGVADQTRVRDQLGFDPNSPVVLHTLSGVWTEFDPDSETAPTTQRVAELASGYVEFSLDAPPEAETENPEPAPPVPPPTVEPPPPARPLDAPATPDAPAAAPRASTEPAGTPALAPPRPRAASQRPAVEPALDLPNEPRPRFSLPDRKPRRPKALATPSPSPSPTRATLYGPEDEPAAPPEPSPGRPAVELVDRAAFEPRPAATVERRGSRAVLLVLLALCVVGAVGSGVILWKQTREV